MVMKFVIRVAQQVDDVKNNHINGVRHLSHVLKYIGYHGSAAHDIHHSKTKFNLGTQNGSPHRSMTHDWLMMFRPTK
jgi:hypothetical protein